MLPPARSGCKRLQPDGSVAYRMCATEGESGEVRRSAEVIDRQRMIRLAERAGFEPALGI